MACVSGSSHTITLSNDGVVHSFGKNDFGQLGLGDNNDHVPLPSRIVNLPKIMQVSCGEFFAACVDDEGLLWTFGCNNHGQLGTGDTTLYNSPQKIVNIPPVHSVACGFSHTLIITKDSNLWSCGYNIYGQLCLGNKENQLTFQQTSFSNIVKISTSYHSLFQNNNEEIFACGYNSDGGLGLGHCGHQITPTLIPNLPPNIIQFICGKFHTLFLDSEGNAFSVGYNQYGQLGHKHNTQQNVLYHIQNIPPIQSISCVGDSSYLIDYEKNVWGFGDNECKQLGLGYDSDRNIYAPTKIESLTDIQQISYGPTGCHFFAKDSQSKIFAAGANYYGQLGMAVYNGDLKNTGNINPNYIAVPKEINLQYFTIWGESQITSRAKSARK